MRPLIAVVAIFLAACSPDSNDPVDIADSPGFIGSEQCATCHETEYQRWRGSHHELAMQSANESTILGDFSDVTVPYFETSARFFMRDGRYLAEVCRRSR